MKTAHNTFPIFEANQILSNSHLNQLFNYLDAQERLTRANLIGIGIACGLECRLDAATATIHLSKGCGVTSEGYLLVQQDDVKLVASRKYTLPPKVDYAPLTDASNAGNLLELLPTDEPGATLLSAVDLKDKALLLFLELKQDDLRTCSSISCDDRGAAVGATVRRLLIPKADLKPLIAAAHELEPELTFTDLETALLERINLTDLRLPRFDVPNTGPVTANALLAAFHAVFRTAELATKLGDALSAAYKAFKPLIQAIYPTDPFAAFEEKFGFLDDAPTTRAQVQFLQYYYDLFDDLLRAYDEFRWVGVELLCACVPSGDRFPRHLLLGLLSPTAANQPTIYRQSFMPSPAIGACEARTKELQLLFQRLVTMVEQFTHTPPLPPPATAGGIDAQIRITPSKVADVPLSEKAIPYYYLQESAPPLYQLWNAEKSRRNRANQNLSYRADEYAPEKSDFVRNPLRYDIEPYNFLRIEGHLGKNYQITVNSLLALQRIYRLPIDIIALPTGKELELFLEKNSGIQHKAGVSIGGTFIVVYLSDISDGSFSEMLKDIAAGTIIADFYLPYRRIDSVIYTNPAIVRQCEHKWIDSMRHINNLSLRDYRFAKTEKAPAANEEERQRLRNRYIIRIYKYEIQGVSMLPGGKYRDIEIPISSLRVEKLSAIARKLNETFPLGLVFDYSSVNNKLIMRHIDGHHFRIELGGIQGNQIRYAYENNKLFRWQKQEWEELDQLADSKEPCHIWGGRYEEEAYKWVHENYKPRYPKPTHSPTVKEVIQWEQMIAKRAKEYASAGDLPIYERVLQPLREEIRKIDTDAKVILVGSWANGSWISRNESENGFMNGDKERFLQLRAKVTGKTGYNEINLLIKSDHQITPDMIKISSGYRITVFRGSEDAQKGLLLK